MTTAPSVRRAPPDFPAAPEFCLARVPQAPLLRTGALFGPLDAAELFVRLLRETDWRDGHFVAAGRRFALPRRQAWHSDADVEYRYDENLRNSHPWTPLLERLRRRVEDAAGARFNAVLLNLYRDGADSVGWHADDEADLGPAPVIASLTLGARREFSVRPKRGGTARALALPAGTLLVMDAPFQRDWEHAVPPDPGCAAPRINLTFRRVFRPAPAGAGADAPA